MNLSVPTGGEGSTGNLGHLNLSTPLPVRRKSRRLTEYHERIRAEAAARAKIRSTAIARMQRDRYLELMRKRRLRKAMIVRELVSLGLIQAHIARVCGVSKTYITVMVREFGLPKAKAEKYSSPLCQGIRAGYERRLSVKAIAEQVGSTPDTVKSLASQMGIANRNDWRARERGFDIPDDRRAEYRELTRLGCTPREAGMCMGLLPRTGDLQ